MPSYESFIYSLIIHITKYYIIHATAAVSILSYANSNNTVECLTE